MHNKNQTAKKAFLSFSNCELLKAASSAFTRAIFSFVLTCHRFLGKIFISKKIALTDLVGIKSIKIPQSTCKIKKLVVTLFTH